MSHELFNGTAARVRVLDAQEQEMAQLRAALRGIQKTLFLVVQAAGGDVLLTDEAASALSPTACLEMEEAPEGARLFISGAGDHDDFPL